MKKIKTLLASVAVLVGAGVSVAEPTVHTIGDSTMAEYDETKTVTRGWGQYLDQYLTGMTVNNRGKNGASSRSFYEESAYWASVKKQMKEGDYLVISFSHNDEKNDGMDGEALIAYYKSTGNSLASSTDYRGTNPSTTYKEYLTKMVNEARELGVTPILCGPICRMYFTGGKIRRNGRHDLGDNFSILTESGVKTGQKVPETDHSMDYPYQMKAVAEEMNVPYIDLTTATAELFESYGDSQCHAILSDGDGSTHLSATGAALIARRFASLCEEAGLLEGHVNVSADISVTPASADFGRGYSGQQLEKEFMVSGFDLNPASGTVTITAETGVVELSSDRTNWAKSISIAYKDGNIVERFYARMPLTTPGVISEKISVVAGDKTFVITATGECVELAGGTEVDVYWRLESDDSYTMDGPVIVQPEAWSKMYVQRYSAPNANTTWPDGTGFDASRKTQRNLLDGDIWPAGEIDEVSDRYIEFGVTAVEGTTLNIDRISYYVCGCGGNGMCVKVYYSTEDNFANPQLIFERKKMPANSMLDGTVTPVIELAEGQTCRLRFYPWYDGTASGKTICLSDVRFHGYASSSSGVQNVAIGKTAAMTEYYNLQGVKLNAPAAGVNIVKTVYTDGTVSTSKIVY
ncbi:MAG: rhamnogalacturonan acetylesterase [Muribaculaceae bacterium]|nr:rhamnogalacturonan acetylesterase [Muribaculaceae bacterium]